MGSPIVESPSSFLWPLLEKDELDYFVNLAVDECTFWLEAITRERIICEDDFLICIRGGTHLRRLLNLLQPGLLDTDTWQFISDGYEWPADVDFKLASFLHTYHTQPPIGRLLQTTNEARFDDAGLTVYGTLSLFHVWTSPFLYVCWRFLKIPQSRLFLTTDLETHGISAGATETVLDRIRRVVCTVDSLARLYEKSDVRSLIRYDKSATLPLIAYHDWLSSNVATSTCSPWQTAASSSNDVRLSAHSPQAGSSDENCHWNSPRKIRMDCDGRENVTGALDVIPDEDRHSNAGRSLATSGQSRSSSSVVRPVTASNPLRFVAANRSAASLAAQAKEQMQLAEEMKKQRKEVVGQVDDDDTQWLSNLDQWKMKRKTSSTAVFTVSETSLRDGVHSTTVKTTTSTTADVNASSTSLRKLSFNQTTNTVEKAAGAAGTDSMNECLKSSSKAADGIEVEKQNDNNTTPAFVNKTMTTVAVSETVDCILEKMDSSSFREEKLTKANLHDSGHFDDLSDTSKHSRDSSFGNQHHQNTTQTMAIGAMPSPGSDGNADGTSTTDYASSGFSPGADSGADSLSPSQHSPQETKPVLSPLKSSLYYSTPRPFQPAKTTKPAFIAPTAVEEEPATVLTTNAAAPTPTTFVAVSNHSITTATTAAVCDDGRKDELPVDYDEFTVSIEQKPQAEKGFGFSIKGGKDRKEPVIVDAVVVGTPADKRQLQIGDQLLSINSEDVAERYHIAVNRMINEALRLGEIELLVRRKRTSPGGKRNLDYIRPSEDREPENTPIPKPFASFDQKRSLFDQKQNPDPYYQFRKQRHSVPVVAATKRWSSPAMRNPGAGRSVSSHYQSAPSPKAVTKAISSEEESYQKKVGRPGRIENFVPEIERERPLSPPKGDYVVTSICRRRSPGRLTDFVPEVERQEKAQSPISDDVGRRVGGAAVEQPKPLRNYDLGLHNSPVGSSTRCSTESLSITSSGAISPPLPPPPAELLLTATNDDEEQQPKLDKDSTRQRYLVIQQQRRASPTTPPSSPHVGPSKPFAHVKKDIIFSNEPIPQGKSADVEVDHSEEPAVQKNTTTTITVQAPTNLHTVDRSSADQQMPAVQQTSFQHPHPESVADGILSHKKLPLNEAEKTELLYLNLAAATTEATESNVDADLDGPIAVRQTSPAVKSHWLLNETMTPTRLSDQLRSDRIALSPRSDNRHSEYENLTAVNSQANGTTVGQPLSPQEPILSVSGRHHCSHCSQELGRGAAMVIESLELFYHLDCFRCCVCEVLLGSGDRGTDVRVRSGRLHCQSCYSNDEEGLKYSEV